MKNKLILSAFFFIFAFAGVCHAEISNSQAKIYRERFVDEIKSCIGKPYSYGSVGPDKFDCSGLVYYAAQKSTGIQLPRTAKAIYNYVTIIPESEREIGDLLFFKTTLSASVSHVGVYIGDNKFISAISDGPNRGVAVTSLSQEYWKSRYVATGKFIKTTGKKDSSKVTAKKDDDTTAKEKSPFEKTETVKQNAPEDKAGKNITQKKNALHDDKEQYGVTAHSSFYDARGTFAQNIVFDASAYIDWALISPKSLEFKFRGADFQIGARFAKINMEPGIAAGFRYDSGLGIIQIPLVISFTLNDYFKAYAGPVFTFGDAALSDINKKVKPSVLPGTVGISISTPSIKAGKTTIQFVQDISYNTCNNTDGSALPFLESVATGLVFYSGLKLTLPLKSLIK